MDLTNLRPGDRLNLYDDLWSFLGYPPEGGADVADADYLTVPKEELTEYITSDAIAALQAEVLGLLQWAAAANRAAPSSPAFALSAQWHLTPFEGGQISLTAYGSVHDLFLTRLIFLLAQEGFQSLNVCHAPHAERPECGRIFWRVGRKQYCSRQCTNRAVFQRWSKSTKKGKTRSRRESERQKKERKEHKRRLEEAKQRYAAEQAQARKRGKR